jgi:hypothetical protein
MANPPLGVINYKKNSTQNSSFWVLDETPVLRICEMFRICRINCKMKSPVKTIATQYICGFISPTNEIDFRVYLVEVTSIVQTNMLKVLNNKYEK